MKSGTKVRSSSRCIEKAARRRCLLEARTRTSTLGWCGRLVKNSALIGRNCQGRRVESEATRCCHLKRTLPLKGRDQGEGNVYQHPGYQRTDRNWLGKLSNPQSNLSQAAILSRQAGPPLSISTSFAQNNDSDFIKMRNSYPLWNGSLKRDTSRASPACYLTRSASPSSQCGDYLTCLRFSGPKIAGRFQFSGMCDLGRWTGKDHEEIEVHGGADCLHPAAG